jgi:hypothetical protein
VHLSKDSSVRSSRPWLIAAFLLAVAASASAGDLAPSAKVEIDALLDRLGSSQCQFYRNGTWHTAPEAEDHLKVKLDYLVKRGRVSTTEEFIEKAGTRSSISGWAYKVQCPNQAEQPSAAWLATELQQIRKGDGQ